MNWFAEQRQLWILDMLSVYGFINREHLMKKFGISQPQASKDLRIARRDMGSAMVYNPTLKRYE